MKKEIKTNFTRRKKLKRPASTQKQAKQTASNSTFYTNENNNRLPESPKMNSMLQRHLILSQKLHGNLHTQHQLISHDKSDFGNVISRKELQKGSEQTQKHVEKPDFSEWLKGLFTGAGSREVMAGTIENFAENLFEKKIPPAKYANIARKLSIAFAEGIKSGVKRADEELHYDSVLRELLKKEEYTVEDIEKFQYLRRWQANSVSKLKGILADAMINVIKEGSEMIAEEITGMLVERPLQNIGKAIGDFAGDVLTGDYVKAINLIGQSAEDKVEGAVSAATQAIAEAFAQSVASYFVGSGVETIFDTKQQLERNNLPSSAAEEVGHAMKVELVGKDVDRKIQYGLQKMKRQNLGARGEQLFQNFKDAYAQLIEKKKKLDELNSLNKFFSKEDEALKQELKSYAMDASGALYSLGNLHLPSDKSNVSFEVDIKIINQFL